MTNAHRRYNLIPTSTAHQARLQLYQPTRRPVWKERRIEGSWGTALVRGKIGQVHADIVEAICRNAEKIREIEPTGHLQVLVDPYKVRMSVGGGTPYSHATLWKMLRELRETSIVLEVPSQNLKILGGLLDRVEESPAKRLNPLTQQDRSLWRVTFDPAFSLMLKNDLSLHYDPAPLAKIESGVSQAIARHILTHRSAPQGGWMLDSLLTLVGIPDDAVTRRNRRREVRNCAAQLQTLGIEVEGDRVFMSEPDGRKPQPVTV